MFFKNRIVRGTLVAVATAVAVASVPAAGIGADAGGKHSTTRAILR